MAIKIKIKGGIADASELGRVTRKVDGARGVHNRRDGMAALATRATGGRRGASTFDDTNVQYRVELTLSGGTNGTATSQPSYSYVPREYIIGAPGTGDVLSGTQQPEYRSQQFGTVQPPSGPILGWGYTGTDGQFHIASADEVWQVRNDCGTA